MRRTVKRESEATGISGGSREADEDEPNRLRSVKNEKLRKNRASLEQPEGSPSQDEEIRSQYLALINKISDSKKDLMRVDPDKFTRFFNEVGNLHLKVEKPREQTADAEALLDIANTLMSLVKSPSSHGVSPAEFVNALVSGFGQGFFGN